MPPHPFYSWKSFWLGILVLAVFVGAWARSTSHSTSVLVNRGAGKWRGLTNSDGYLSWSKMTSLPGSGPFGLVDSPSSSIESPPRWFRPALRRIEVKPAPTLATSTSYGVAWWVLTLLFLIPWSGSLARRWQRMQRQANPLGSLTPLSLRPFSRWKSLWIGIFIFLCLVWSWKRAFKYMDHASYQFGPGGPAIMAVHGGSKVSLVWQSRHIPSGSSFFTRKIFPREPEFAPAVSVGRNDSGGWHLAFAHWFLILIFLLAWISFLAWKWRRISRIETNTGHQTATIDQSSEVSATEDC